MVEHSAILMMIDVKKIFIAYANFNMKLNKEDKYYNNKQINNMPKETQIPFFIIVHFSLPVFYFGIGIYYKKILMSIIYTDEFCFISAGYGRNCILCYFSIYLSLV
jgi:hypothetical protein